MILRARVCVYDFPHVFQILRIRQILLSFPILLFPPFFLHYYPSGCRRRGAGLALDHRMAASTGAMRRGAPCERGRPRDWPGLSRALALTPQFSNVPAAGTNTGSRDSGWPRTDGSGCGVCGKKVCRRRDTVLSCPGGRSSAERLSQAGRVVSEVTEVGAKKERSGGGRWPLV